MTANTSTGEDDDGNPVACPSCRQWPCGCMNTPVSDEDLTRAIAYYRSTPTRVWGSNMVSALTELQSRRAAQPADEWCVDMRKALPLFYDILSRRSAQSADDVEAVRVAIRDEWRGGCARVCRIENASNNLECACHDLAALATRALGTP